ALPPRAGRPVDTADAGRPRRGAAPGADRLHGGAGRRVRAARVSRPGGGRAVGELPRADPVAAVHRERLGSDHAEHGPRWAAPAGGDGPVCGGVGVPGRYDTRTAPGTYHLEHRSEETMTPSYGSGELVWDTTEATAPRWVLLLDGPAEAARQRVDPQ